MTDPVSATTAVLTSFTHANNLIKAILGVRDNVVNLEQVNALPPEISTVQTGYFSLLQQNTSLLLEIDNLKKEITRFETWDAQKNRYKLYSPWDSAVVYAITESQSNVEPPHWICPQCYENRKRSFLYSRHDKNGLEEFFCHCGVVVTSKHRGNHKIEYCTESVNV